MKNRLTIFCSVFLTFAVLLSAGCSKFQEAKQAVVEKTVGKLLESATGDTKVTKTDEGLTATLGNEEDERSLSVSIKSKNNHDSETEMFILPGSSLLSYIKGVNDDTINLHIEASIEQVERGYAELLSREGYIDNGSIFLNGMYAGRWKNQETGSETLIYAYQDGAATRLSVVFSHSL